MNGAQTILALRLLLDFGVPQVSWCSYPREYLANRQSKIAVLAFNALRSGLRAIHFVFPQVRIVVLEILEHESDFSRPAHDFTNAYYGF